MVCTMNSVSTQSRPFLLPKKLSKASNSFQAQNRGRSYSPAINWTCLCYPKYWHSEWPKVLQHNWSSLRVSRIGHKASSEFGYSVVPCLWKCALLRKQRFYYADERQADGGPSIPVNGPAAAEAYLELAEKKEQGPWDYTFVKGKGYVDFKEAWMLMWFNHVGDPQAAIMWSKGIGL